MIPTRYQGGKNGAGVYQAIINCIPWHWRYVEAFAGSAAVFRNKLPARGGSILIERDADQAARLRDLASPAISPSVTIAAADALELLPSLKLGSDDFVYLDPPYHHDTRRDLDLYKFELSDTDHRHLVLSLLPALSDRHVRWALSGYRGAVYDDAAAKHGWHRKDYVAATRRGPAIESLWTNFDPAMVDLHDHRYLGDDFRERERITRKVRRWVRRLEVLPRHERAAIMAALANPATIGDEDRRLEQRRQQRGAPEHIASSGERIPGP